MELRVGVEKYMCDVFSLYELGDDLIMQGRENTSRNNMCWINKSGRSLYDLMYLSSGSG